MILTLIVTSQCCDSETHEEAEFQFTEIHCILSGEVTLDKAVLGTVLNSCRKNIMIKIYVLNNSKNVKRYEIKYNP